MYNSLREKISQESEKRRDRQSSYSAILQEAHKAGLLTISALLPEKSVNPGSVHRIVRVRVKRIGASFVHYAKRQGWKPALDGGIFFEVQGMPTDNKIPYAISYIDSLRQNGIPAYVEAGV